MSGDEPPLPTAAGASAGRSGQLAEIFHRHAAFVFRVLRRLGLSAADAEDGMQEVFLVVNARLEDYEERGAARAWLYAICRHVARSHHRRSGRTRPAGGVEEALAAPGDPEQSFARAQGMALVDEFLGTLSESQAAVFYLSEVEELTAPELAEAIGVGVNTVYSRLRLARDRFETFVARRAKRGGPR